MAVESKKILPVIEKYLVGEGIEIGCGSETIIDGVFGVDGRDFPCVDFITDNLYDLPKQLSSHVGKYDFLVSSHTAEHLPDLFRTVSEWSQFVKSGGYFILYLPHSGAYDNYSNPEHFWDTEYNSFMFWFEQTFCGKGRNFKGEQYATPIFETVESGLDIGDDRYSFYLVARKL